MEDLIWLRNPEDERTQMEIREDVFSIPMTRFISTFVDSEFSQSPSIAVVKSYNDACTIMNTIIMMALMVAYLCLS